MVQGRRAVGANEPARWVFNRIADVYDARPEYPPDVVDAVAALAGKPGARIGDFGAGTGRLSFPLAARGFDVTAVEPAEAMLDRLRAGAALRGLFVRDVHASAEAAALEPSSLDLALIADAVHFLDAELTGPELARALAPGGALAVVTSDLAETPYMQSVGALMQSAAPRRPRAMGQAIVQLFKTARVPLEQETRFADATPVDAARLENILRSISFIGPAMNAERFAAFREKVVSLPEPAVWARTFTVYGGKRRR